MSKNLSLRLSFTIDENASGLRVDKALALHPQIESRSQSLKLIAAGRVLLNGQVPKPSHKTTAGERYDIELPPPQTEELIPYELPLTILFEDEDLIVIDKPSGLVVHPAAGHEQDTLVNALLAHNKSLSSGSHPFRPGIVHRIDKDTSGTLVIAKNDFSHRRLAEQFKNKTAHRIYLALCFGVPRNKSGRIESLIGRHPQNRKKFSSQKSGRQAVTHFQVEKTRGGALSLLRLRLETGRTHQIRVHLSELGHPIVGDPLYCPANKARTLKAKSVREQVTAIDRLCLHAAELGFEHPRSKEKIMFQTDWPEPLRSQLGTVMESE